MRSLTKIVLLSLVPLSLTATQDCTTDVSKCPTLVTASDDALEPSGVVWAGDLGVAIGVDDERGNRPRYEVFAFDPTASGKIQVTPLLTMAQSNAYQMDDLEGITRLPNGRFVVTGSLSLDADANNPEDRWSRHRAFQLEIVRESGNLVVKTVEGLSEDRRPDMREWFISGSGMDWVNQSYARRAESGGINVEGLVSTAQGKLLFGFRGPLLPGFLAPVGEIDVAGKNAMPGPAVWRFFNGTHAPAGGGSIARGVRAMELVPGTSDQYVMIVGHTGGAHDRLRVGLWNSTTGVYTDRFYLPARFVGEGIAVKSSTDTKLALILVSDLSGYMMNLEINR